jgi:hypothetical protein
LTGTTAGLEIKEFCRREEPTVFDVRVGFVRVCLDEVRRFEVAREVAVVVAMAVEAVRMGRSLARGGFVAIVKIFSSGVVMLGKVEILDQRGQWDQ